MEFGPEIAADNGGVKLPWLTDDELVMCNWDGYAQGGPYEVSDITGWSNGLRIRLPADHWAYPVIAQGFIPWAGGDNPPGDWEPYGEVLFANGSSGGRSEHWDWRGRGAPADRVGALIIGYRRKAEQATPTFKAGDYVVATKGSAWIGEGETRQITDIQEFKRANASHRCRPATTAEIEQYHAEKALVAQYEGEPLPATVPTVELPVMTEEEVRRGFLAVFDADGFATAEDDCVTYLRTLGLIKPALTPLEAFETAHGGLDNNQRDIVEAFISWQETQA